MAAELKNRYQVDVELIQSGGGVFVVVADGDLIFSKKKLDRFPENHEIFEELDTRKNA